MANWISSKLKVAETFFEQIDHQAAESLKKNDLRSIGSEDQKVNNVSSPALVGGDKTVPLKDQLKRKSTSPVQQTSVNGNGNVNVEYIAKLNADPIVNDNSNLSKPTLSDSDWTQLLSSNPPARKDVKSPNRSNGSSTTIRGFRKEVRKQGSPGSGLSLKRNNSVKNKRLDVALGNSKSNGKASDEDNYSSSSASVELHIDGKVSDGGEVGRESDKRVEKCEASVSEEVVLPMGNKVCSLEISSLASGKVDEVSDEKKGVGNVYDRQRSSVKEKDQSSAALSRSEGESDSDSDSVSTSDSESEREREMREKILAEKAAAKAVEAIKERENMVARLEGEKQSLEKILEERAKQQALEASELQTTMMETMEAVEVEKQKHNNTRMEALARLATPEIANADLARSLAIAQKTLEMELNRVAELRQQFELKEVSHEELRRKIFKTGQSGTYQNQATAPKGVEFEREILEAEYSFLTDKIALLEDKAKQLEEKIEMTRKDIEDPTEVEIELKRRLAQLTDHLIQKQAQVEALSSEKATLLFRIEAVSRLLDENGSNLRDVESGTWEMGDSKLRPLFEEKMRSGRKHLGSLLQQLDAIFIAGAVFIRRNPAAKLWSLVYLVLLHFWVIYIFLSNSRVSDVGRSGAAISLESINQTAGI
ncbi:golgin candidate 2 [Mercurialis annua]|uniref:golgin candidate 2 n=1 Tax=Mercurialis annua TaxID=3986 RepID=UPI00215DF4FB|nr:golgin candidate 2 [Mercurialis annua]